MNTQAAIDEYSQALRQGQKEYRELLMAGLSPHPAVLDEILPESSMENVADLGLVDIPAERIIGVKSAGRVTAFTASFRPLLDTKSEFYTKWVALCGAHLTDAGITDPILCYEYLGNFYVQEGNKRAVSCGISVPPESPAMSGGSCPPAPRSPGSKPIMNSWTSTSLPGCIPSSSAAPVIMPGC